MRATNARPGGYDALAGELRALFPGRTAFVNAFFPDVKQVRKAPVG